MVFGWKKKKTEDEELVPNVSERQITFSEIDRLLEDKKRLQLEVIRQDITQIASNVKIQIKEILDIINQLEKDTLKMDDADRNLKIIAERSKNAVVTGLRKETTIDFSEIKRFSDVIEMNSQISQLLKRIGDILGINSRALHIFAKKYADKLKTHIANIATQKEILQKIIDRYSTINAEYDSILEDCSKIMKYNTEINTQEAEIKKRKEHANICINIINEKEMEIQKQKSKNEYQEFLKTTKEIELFLPEKEKIKHIIDLQFSKISRPLGKYSYVSALEKPLKNIMEILLSNPIEVITRDNKNSIIEILQTVVKGVVSGNISVKDKEKTIEQIEETMQRIDEFTELKEKFYIKISSMKEKQNIFDIKHLQELENVLEKTKQELAQEESKIKHLEKTIEEHSKLIPQYKTNIEQKMKTITNSKIILKIENQS